MDYQALMDASNRSLEFNFSHVIVTLLWEMRRRLSGPEVVLKQAPRVRLEDEHKILL